MNQDPWTTNIKKFPHELQQIAYAIMESEGTLPEIGLISSNHFAQALSHPKAYEVMAQLKVGQIIDPEGVIPVPTEEYYETEDIQALTACRAGALRALDTIPAPNIATSRLIPVNVGMIAKSHKLDKPKKGKPAEVPDKDLPEELKVIAHLKGKKVPLVAGDHFDLRSNKNLDVISPLISIRKERLNALGIEPIAKSKTTKEEAEENESLADGRGIYTPEIEKRREEEARALRIFIPGFYPRQLSGLVNETLSGVASTPKQLGFALKIYRDLEKASEAHTEAFDLRVGNQSIGLIAPLRGGYEQIEELRLCNGNPQEADLETLMARAVALKPRREAACLRLTACNVTLELDVDLLLIRNVRRRTTDETFATEMLRTLAQQIRDMRCSADEYHLIRHLRAEQELKQLQHLEERDAKEQEFKRLDQQASLTSVELDRLKALSQELKLTINREARVLQRAAESSSAMTTLRQIRSRPAQK